MSDRELAVARAAVDAAPADARLRYRLAQLQEDARDLPAAVESVRTAIRLSPDYAEAHGYLGLLLADSGDIEGAIASLRQAVVVKPDYVRAWNNLGSALRNAGRLAEAVDAIRNALRLQPDYARGHATLGLLLRDLGDEAAAEASLRTAIRLRADLRVALVGLAGLLQRQSRLDESAELYLRAIKLEPAAQEWFQLGVVLAERGDPVKAREAFARAVAADPRHLQAALGLRLTLPMLYDSADDVAAARAAYATGLAALGNIVPRCLQGRPPSDVLDAWQWNNFLLAYQGRDDRQLQAAVRGAGRAFDRCGRARTCGEPCRSRRLRAGASASVSRRHSSRPGPWACISGAGSRGSTARNSRRSRITCIPASMSSRARSRQPSTRIAISSVRGGAWRTWPRPSAPTRSTSSCIRSSACIRCRSRSPRFASRRCNAPHGGTRPRPAIRRSTTTSRPPRWSRRTPHRTTARRWSCCRASARSTRRRRYRRTPIARDSRCPGTTCCSCARNRCSRCIRTTTACWRRSSRPRATRRSCCSPGAIPR